jgi:hypothetical protein
VAAVPSGLSLTPLRIIKKIKKKRFLDERDKVEPVFKLLLISF